MSPTWPDIQASRPSARQKVFLRSPPTASDGRGLEGQGERQRGVAAGAADRRLALADRTVTESSQGTWIGRSWVSQASARPASRASASSSSVTIGSPARLPLVITSTSAPGGRRAARAAGGAAGCRPASPRGRRWPGCDGVGRRHRAGGAARTIGRPRPASSAASVGVEVDEPSGRRRASRDHHRERLVAALLALAQHRDRRLAGRVAGQVVAADALDRDDRAVARAATGPRRARSSSYDVSAAGRDQAQPSVRSPGQQTVWAWKRRSAGSAYSAAQAAHIGKPAIVVAGRS